MESSTLCFSFRALFSFPYLSRSFSLSRVLFFWYFVPFFGKFSCKKVGIRNSATSLKLLQSCSTNFFNVSDFYGISSLAKFISVLLLHSFFAHNRDARARFCAKSKSFSRPREAFFTLGDVCFFSYVHYYCCCYMAFFLSSFLPTQQQFPHSPTYMYVFPLPQQRWRPGEGGGGEGQ